MLRKDGKPVSVLTSDVHNEAEVLFAFLQEKDRKLISHLDCLTLMRGMGMNPIQADMDKLRDVMKEDVAELSRVRAEEALAAEKERERLAKKDPKAQKEKEMKDKADKEKAEAEAKKAKEEAEANGGANGPKKKVLAPPEEEEKAIDWNIFIKHVEPMYRDNREEVRLIIEALREFQTPQKQGTITIRELEDIVCRQNGESVLSPAEFKQVRDILKITEENDGEEIDLTELAQKIQGTYQGPTEEEKAAAAAMKEEEERKRREAEAAKKKAAEDDLLV